MKFDLGKKYKYNDDRKLHAFLASSFSALEAVLVLLLTFLIIEALTSFFYKMWPLAIIIGAFSSLIIVSYFKKNFINKNVGSVSTYRLSSVLLFILVSLPFSWYLFATIRKIIQEFDGETIQLLSVGDYFKTLFDFLGKNHKLFVGGSEIIIPAFIIVFVLFVLIAFICIKIMLINYKDCIYIESDKTIYFPEYAFSLIGKRDNIKEVTYEYLHTLKMVGNENYKEIVRKIDIYVFGDDEQYFYATTKIIGRKNGNIVYGDEIKSPIFEFDLKNFYDEEVLEEIETTLEDNSEFDELNDDINEYGLDQVFDTEYNDELDVANNVSVIPDNVIASFEGTGELSDSLSEEEYDNIDDNTILEEAFEEDIDQIVEDSTEIESDYEDEITDDYSIETADVKIDTEEQFIEEDVLLESQYEDYSITPTEENAVLESDYEDEYQLAEETVVEQDIIQQEETVESEFEDAVVQEIQNPIIESEYEDEIPQVVEDVTLESVFEDEVPQVVEDVPLESVFEDESTKTVDVHEDDSKFEDNESQAFEDISLENEFEEQVVQPEEDVTVETGFENETSIIEEDQELESVFEDDDISIDETHDTVDNAFEDSETNSQSDEIIIDPKFEKIEPPMSSDNVSNTLTDFAKFESNLDELRVDFDESEQFTNEFEDQTQLESTFKPSEEVMLEFGEQTQVEENKFEADAQSEVQDSFELDDELKKFIMDYDIKKDLKDNYSTSEEFSNILEEFDLSFEDE